jgi:transcriptional regulator with XRE-family HTH domain
MPLILTREDAPRVGAARAVFDTEVFPDKSEVRGDRISVNPGSADGEDLRMACVRAMECALVQGFERIFFSARDSVVSAEALADAVKAAVPAFLENGWLAVYLRCPEPDPAPEEKKEESSSPLPGPLGRGLRRLFRRLRRLGETAEPTQEREEPEEAYRSRLEESFGSALERLQREKGLSDGELCRRANVGRRTLLRLREEKDFIPSRNAAIALAFALELSAEERRELLARAGYVLSRDVLSDVILEDYVKKESFDIYAVNETLFRCGLPPLGAED